MKDRVGVWVEALRVIPAVTKQQWDDYDVIARWLIATRSAVLVMTLVSALVAGLLAFRDGRFDAVVWALIAVGLVFAHAANNLINDLTDHAKGVDAGNYFRAQYGPQPLEHGLMTRATMLRYIGVTLGIALAAGVALVVLRGGATLTLLGIGLVFVLFYTWPMKFIGLGEVAVLVVWGPLMVGGGYYVLSGQCDLDVMMASVPLSLGATTVIFGKHIDKLEQGFLKFLRQQFFQFSGVIPVSG
ncbi:MAG: prenyltransferase [Myxococcota bacterium]